MDQRIMRRGGFYYVRVKVPEVLREARLIRQREFKRSLGTSNLAEARGLFVLEVAKFDAEIIEAHRRLKLQKEPIKTLPRPEMEHLAVQLLHSKKVNGLSPLGQQFRYPVSSHDRPLAHSFRCGVRATVAVEIFDESRL